MIILTFLFCLDGSSYGMAEEGLVFYPILVPVFLAAGYDLLVPVAVIFAGTPGREMVNAYLFGMGIMGFITPTGLILPLLALTNLNIKIWWYFIYPLLLLCTTLLIIGIYIP
jgi:uncharacterized ion transporter superfamily protein YfcC